MPCALNSEYFFDPSDHLMRARIGWLIKIDDTVLEVLLKRPFEWCRAGRNRSIMRGEYIHLIIVLEQEWPFCRVQARPIVARLQDILINLLLVLHFHLYELLLFTVLAHCVVDKYLNMNT